MSDDIIRFESITHLHEMVGYEKPKHPLISVMHASKMPFRKEMAGARMSSNMYCIMMKSGECDMRYGRNHYDFEEGTLVFMAPNQVVSGSDSGGPWEGWMLFFHPDLIRRSDLGKRIDDYTFFSYDVHEALHLSDKEKQLLTDCVARIEDEYNTNIDAHSQTLFVSSLQLMLDYSNRFYERQFHTRSNHHKDLLTQVEEALKNYADSGQLTDLGVPTVQLLADKVNLSANYLSDLLKKETGHNAKEHINRFVIDKAKTLLLSTNQSVSQIAYDLGFNYPHYFSRMFKQQTGFSPKDYRVMN